MNVGVDVVDKPTLAVPVQRAHAPAINPLVIVAHSPDGKLHNKVRVELQLRSSSRENNLELLWERLGHPLQLGLDGTDQKIRIKFYELGDGEILYVWSNGEELVVGKGLLDGIQQRELLQENDLLLRT